MATRTMAIEDHGRYRWAVVCMLWVICFFNYADRQAIYSVYPLLKRELHVSDLELGILGSAFMWVYAFSAPFGGYLGDRFRRKTIILGGFFFWSAIALLTGISRKLWHLIAFRATEGLGEAGYFPSSMSLIGAYHGRRTRSRAMSIHQSGVYIGTIGGGALAGLLGERYGWRMAFYVFGTLGILVGLFLLKLIKEPVSGHEPSEVSDSVRASPGTAREQSRDPAGLRRGATTPLLRTGPGREPLSTVEFLGLIVRRRLPLVLMLVFLGANFVAMVFLTWMPSFLYEKFHMSLTMAGLTATVFIQMASIVGVLAGGALADFLARRWAGGRMITQACGLFLGAPFIFVAGTTMHVPTLVVALTVFGFSKGLYDSNIFAALFDVIPREARATASGVMIAVGWLGGAAAPIAIGAAAATVGMSHAIAYNGVTYFVIAILLTLAAVRMESHCVVQ